LFGPGFDSQVLHSMRELWGNAAKQQKKFTSEKTNPSGIIFIKMCSVFASSHSLKKAILV